MNKFKTSFRHELSTTPLAYARGSVLHYTWAAFADDCFGGLAMAPMGLPPVLDIFTSILTAPVIVASMFMMVFCVVRPGRYRVSKNRSGAPLAQLQTE
jgi:hypothetical protein